MRGEFHGGGRFREREPVRDQRAHVELPAEHQPRDLFLQGEIRRVAADQIYFIHADAREIHRSFGSTLRVREQQNFSTTGQQLERLLHQRIHRNGDDDGVEARAELMVDG